MKMTASDFVDPTNEELSAWLLSNIPKEQIDRVFSGDCDICYEFVGFVKTYWHLSKIIPKDYHVYDFGAAYNFQSWFFREHIGYHAIEPEGLRNERFGMIQSENCIIHRLDAKSFIQHCGQIPDNSFAIVNFVPNWYDQDVYELVKSKFQNVYTFYPLKIQKV